MIRANENGRPTEVETPVSTDSRGAIPTADTPQSSVAAYLAQSRAREERILAGVRMVWLLEDILRIRPVRRNVLARTRNGDGEDLSVCPRCLTVMQDEARCQSCGRHGGES